MAGTISSLFSGATSVTITLAQLASSGSVGRISAFIDNTSSKYLSANVYVRLGLGVTPGTAGNPFYVYLSRADNGGTIIPENGTADAAGTFINTPLLGVINTGATGSLSQYYGEFDTSPLGPLGPTFGIGIVNNSGGSLNATAGSSAVEIVGLTYND